MVSWAEPEQAQRRVPENGLPHGFVRNRLREQLQKRPVVEPPGRFQKWPVRRPDAMLGPESVEQGSAVGQRVGKRIVLLRKLGEARQLDGGFAAIRQA